MSKIKVTPHQYYAQARACVKYAVRTADQEFWRDRMYEAMAAAPPELQRLTAAILVHARWAAAPQWTANWPICAGCVGEDLGFWPCNFRRIWAITATTCPVRGQMDRRSVDPFCVPRARTHTFADIRREAKAAGLRW